MIYHPENHGFSDVGIGLESAPNVKVYNNTIFLDHAYSNAIEYRFAVTTGVAIRNNLTNKNISSRNGASATVTHNNTAAQADWFVDAAAADLHLAGTEHGLKGSGVILPEVSDDFDKQARPQSGGVDIGADEYCRVLPGFSIIAPILLLLL